MGSTTVRRIATAALAVLVLAGGALLTAGAAPASAAAPVGITMPDWGTRSGDALVVARVAAADPLAAPTWQYNAELTIRGPATTNYRLDYVRISYPGTNLGVAQFERNDLLGGFMDDLLLPVSDGRGRDLSFPLPQKVRFQLYVEGLTDPAVFELPLVVRDNAIPNGGYYFPTKASDLEEGQYWGYETRHAHDDGGGAPSTGSQSYGYDVQLRRWDGDTWSTLVSTEVNGYANEHYLSWGEPMHAMADGVVVSCYRGEADHDPTNNIGSVRYDHLFGNHVVIDHGAERSVLAHTMDDTIPITLCPDPGQNTNLNIPVAAGQYLGDIGNTGRSTGPHIHLHVWDEATGYGVPAQFVDIRTRAHDLGLADLGEHPTLRPHNGAMLHRNSLILPNPCGLNPPIAGQVEVARHELSEECYLAAYHQAVGRGYHVSFVDGFNVGATPYYNVVFRSSAVGWSHYVATTGGGVASAMYHAVDQGGMRLHQIDSFLSGGQQRFNLVFQHRGGPDWRSFHDLSQADFDIRYDELTSNGYVPVNLSMVEVAGALRYTGLFEKVQPTSWTLLTIPAGNFSATAIQQENAGRQLTFVNGTTIGGAPFLTTIWMSPVGSTFRVAQQTAADYQAAYNTNSVAGRFTRVVTGYDNGAGAARYAAVWRGVPDTTVTSGPPTSTTSAAATFGFTGDNPFVVGFRCALDGANDSACTSPKAYGSLTRTSHTFRVRSVDRDGYADTTPATRTWTVRPVAVDIPQQGSASPYPHAITISGQQGMLTGVTVRLNGLTHTAPDDLGIVLEAPGGRRFALMSEAGGAADLNEVDLVFADAGGGRPPRLPDEAAITSGTYLPTSHTHRSFSVLGTSYGNPGPVAVPAPQSLAGAFAGIDPNGQWKLYVEDFVAEDAGRLESWSLDLTVAPAPVTADFDGNGRTDISVFRASNGRWYTNGQPASVALGAAGDIPVPGQYDNDAAVDRAVFRPSTGQWFVEGALTSVGFGTNGDIPVPGQYDSDPQTDIAVFRPSTGRWYIHGSSPAVAFGASGDVPVPGQYDADPQTDIAVFRPSNGRWYVHGTTGFVQLGASGDVPVPGQYDADPQTDFAVFRPATGRWYVHGAAASTAFGTLGDVPVPGQYDADPQTDFAVVRRVGNDMRWYVQGATGSAVAFGAPTDWFLPLPAAIQRP